MDKDYKPTVDKMAEVAAWWQEQFEIANMERNELKKRLADLHEDYLNLKVKLNGFENPCDCGQPSCQFCGG